MGLCAAHPANEVDTRRDVSPLIAATHLESAVETVVENKEIVRLQEQVAEFGVGNSLIALAAPLHRLLGQHVIDGEILADIAHEFDRTQLRQPLGIVDEASRRGRVIEIQKPRELTTNPCDVLFDLLHGEKRTLGRFPAWIADHPSATADNRDRRMTKPLQTRKRNHRQQATDMKAGRGWIESDVSGELLARDQVAETFRRVVNKTTPLQFGEQVHQPLLYNPVCWSPGV